jgi:hypothetical protein
MRTTIMAALAATLALAACGDGKPEPQAGGLRDLDVSKTQMADGRKADADTLRTRRINGLWEGRTGDVDVQADIGSDGTLSIMAMRSGSVVGQARGTWNWSDDNTLTGSLSGGGSALSGYSSFTGGFPRTDAILITGTDGSMRLDRRRGAPRPAAGSPDVVTPEMMERAYRGGR